MLTNSLQLMTCNDNAIKNEVKAIKRQFTQILLLEGSQ